jgi:hypothetical protein
MCHLGCYPLGHTIFPKSCQLQQHASKAFSLELKSWLASGLRENQESHKHFRKPVLRLQSEIMVLF